jgi:L-threonylcarbamoyladenylate synthase
MDERIAEAAAALSRGEIVAFPTESSYGLGVNALSSQALSRLFALKGREPGKPPPILISDEAMLKLLVARVPPRARELMARFWPGPLTLVLPALPSLPEALVMDGGVGIRRSPHPVADALVARFGGPVTATSANPSGSPAAHNASQAAAMFGDRVHLLDGGDAPGALPSTVARVGDDGVITILRAGALDPARLTE